MENEVEKLKQTINKLEEGAISLSEARQRERKDHRETVYFLSSSLSKSTTRLIWSNIAVVILIAIIIRMYMLGTWIN